MTSNATTQIAIKAPNFQEAIITIEGDTPFVQHRFSQKAREQMKTTQLAGSTAKGKKVREPRDFAAEFPASMYQATDGWRGINAASFRAAMVRACKTVGFEMKLAKLSVFVVADGFDAQDGTPLVRITKGEPHSCEHMVRVGMGASDIRIRAMWDAGWQAQVHIRWDADQFTETDVANLLMRAGMQVGIGEGRPNSTSDSGGMGWGTFIVKGDN